jgi:hypothetical protein
MLSDSQRAAFRFLQARAQDDDSFSAADIERVAGWRAGSFITYKTKHLKEYVKTVGRGRYKITPHFLRQTEEDFHGIVSQSRKTVARFVRTVFDAVLKYEFLLPLTNERKLRAALDELFYRDHLVQRAREIGEATLTTILPRHTGESKDSYMDRVVAKVGSLLGGYSIGHVNGRFRAGGLKTHGEAARTLAERGRYLVDETTAVVRFLLPLEASRKNHGSHFDVTKQASIEPTAFAAELDVARRLFIAFFVESVILDIHGEDEIWFLESGPDGERLYILERARPNEVRSNGAEADKNQLELPMVNPLDGWLRESGYSDVAEKIAKIADEWKKNGVKTRRNWWDVLAGDKKGQPREVAGETFPVIAAIRQRQGLKPISIAVTKSGEKPLPPRDQE